MSERRKKGRDFSSSELSYVTQYALWVDRGSSFCPEGPKAEEMPRFLYNITLLKELEGRSPPALLPTKRLQRHSETERTPNSEHADLCAEFGQRGSLIVDAAQTIY